MSLRQAFVLGAGLGTRLRPLTEDLPKPLVPIFHRPLISYAFDHLTDFGAQRLMVNTHHASAQYRRFFPDAAHAGAKLAFRHEPLLLETGGGLRNIADWVEPETLLVYNGDVLTDLPLERAYQQHQASGYEVTLILRSSNGPLQISLPDGADAISDIRGQMGDDTSPRFLFSGLYFVEPAFIQRIPAGEIVSVVATFHAMLREKVPVGAVVEDRGQWHDLGTIERYHKVHRTLPFSEFPIQAPDRHIAASLHPKASVAADAQCRGTVVAGPGAVIESGAVVSDSILWPGARVAAGVELQNVILRENQVAKTNLVDAVQ